MAIKAKFSVDNREMKKGLQEVDQQAKKTGANIKENMERAGQGFESINKLGGTMEKRSRSNYGNAVTCWLGYGRHYRFGNSCC